MLKICFFLELFTLNLSAIHSKNKKLNVIFKTGSLELTILDADDLFQIHLLFFTQVMKILIAIHGRMPGNIHTFHHYL
jgi:hypothetical protein